MFVTAKHVSSFLDICSVPQICSTNPPAPPWPGLGRGAAVQQEPGSKDPRPGVRLAGSCSQGPGWEMGAATDRRHAMPGYGLSQVSAALDRGQGETPPPSGGGGQNEDTGGRTDGLERQQVRWKRREMR